MKSYQQEFPGKNRSTKDLRVKNRETKELWPESASAAGSRNNAAFAKAMMKQSESEAQRWMSQGGCGILIGCEVSANSKSSEVKASTVYTSGAKADRLGIALAMES